MTEIELIKDPEFYRDGDRYFVCKDIVGEIKKSGRDTILVLKGKIAGDKHLALNYLRKRFCSQFNLNEDLITIANLVNRDESMIKDAQNVL